MTKFSVSKDYVGHRQYREPREVIPYVVAKSTAQRRILQTAIAGILVAAIVSVSVIAFAPTAKSNDVGYSKADIREMIHLVKKVVKT